MLMMHGEPATYCLDWTKYGRYFAKEQEHTDLATPKVLGDTLTGDKYLDWYPNDRQIATLDHNWSKWN